MLDDAPLEREDHPCLLPFLQAVAKKVRQKTSIYRWWIVVQSGMQMVEDEAPSIWYCNEESDGAVHPAHQRQN